MSLQDKIFDVADALEGKPEAELFDEIVTHIGNLERELDKYIGVIQHSARLVVVLKELDGFFDEVKKA